MYDFLGRGIAALVNELKHIRIYESEYKANKFGLSSGIYFYQLTSGSFPSVKKFILMK